MSTNQESILEPKLICDLEDERFKSVLKESISIYDIHKCNQILDVKKEVEDNIGTEIPKEFISEYILDIYMKNGLVSPKTDLKSIGYSFILSKESSQKQAKIYDIANNVKSIFQSGLSLEDGIKIVDAIARKGMDDFESLLTFDLDSNFVEELRGKSWAQDINKEDVLDTILFEIVDCKHQEKKVIFQIDYRTMLEEIYFNKMRPEIEFNSPESSFEDMF
jgi:hypothetical protein